MAAAAEVVPEITPVDKAIDNPEGKPVADHLYAPTPPAPATGVEYAMPCTPSTKDIVTICKSAGAIVKFKLLETETDGVPASVTFTRTLNAPYSDGVPEMTPADVMDKPAGKPVADQLSGVVPPVADIATL